MSSKVKQANFRLPLQYMAMIDEFAAKEDITKAAVITRALDCLKASFDAGEGGRPVAAAGAGTSSAASDSALQSEIDDLRRRLTNAERRANDAEQRLSAANDRAAAAEARANQADSARTAAENRAYEASAASASSYNSSAASAEEVTRLRTLVDTQEATLTEKTRDLALKTTELATKEAELATATAELKAKTQTLSERDARITSLTRQLGEAQAKVQNANRGLPGATTLNIDSDQILPDDGSTATQLINMLGSVMGAFRQQVDDARILGEQEGRRLANEEFKDVLSKARSDGYREAMSYLDDRVLTARDSGAKEERARIANMGIFERRRYLRLHFAA